MKRIRIFWLSGALLTLAVLVSVLPRWVARSESMIGALQPDARTSYDANSSATALEGEKAIEHLKQQGMYGSLQEAMAAIKYEVKYQAQPKLAGLGAAHELSNRANNLLAYVTGEGIEVTSLGASEKPWRLGLKLTGYGYGENLSAVASGEVTAKGNRVSVKKSAIGNRQSAIEEWFINTARGIEHGLTIDARPDHRPPATGFLRLRFAVTGDLQSTLDEAHDGVAFSRESDNVLLSYDKLFVMDAKGRGLQAAMKVAAGELVIEVEDEGAVYPLMIDPLLRQLPKLTASDGAAVDEFGNAVAVSGDTVVVGAHLDDVGANDQGSAYVFVRSGASWVQQQRLTAADGALGDVFGISVAISGSTVVVGADLDDVGANNNQGSAYVFVRSGASWTQQAKLLTSDGAAGDVFGISVAISGDTVVIGAQRDDVGANLDQGSAYVFVRSGAAWTQQAKLTASDGAADDFFGESVAASGDTVVVGAFLDDVGANPSQGSAYVFVRSGASWSQQQQLTASDGATSDFFGRVAISADTVVVGAFNDDVGPNTLQGSAYVFVRSGTSWNQQQQLTAADGLTIDRFGNSVAISGDMVVVGAELDDVGANPDQGSAYLFVCNWTEQQQLTAADGAASDIFGNSVAVSFDTVVVGANSDDVGANTNQGSAYVFVRTGTTWTQQAKLTASDGAASDQFGISVSISGDTVVVGANFDTVGANLQGSAYVFVRSGVSWIQQQQLTAANGAAGDGFGRSVSISGETVVVGANLDDVGANEDQGSAYVFVRSGVSWIQQQQLSAADGAATDFFGASVGISGDTVVIGALAGDVGANTNQGSAYVFMRSGASWTQQAKLTAADGAAFDLFGTSVGISGDTLVIGANFDDVGANSNQGSAYVFVRSGASWNQQQKLTSADGEASDRFGESVAVSGDTVVVGASNDDVGANSNQGSAYVFMRSGLSWYEQQQLTASNGAESDDYGISVAVGGNTIIVGADLDDVGGANQGSAYIYFMGCNTAPTAAANNVIRQKGSFATTLTVANVFDSEDPIGYLTVTVASAPTGIQISGITNTNGVITASIAAACNSTLGNNAIVWRVQDSDGGVTSTTTLVNVTPNTAPALGVYPNSAVTVLGSTTATPNLTPSDNGSLASLSATSPTFTGILSIDLDTGIVSISNARPGGTHAVTVTAIDNCGVATTSGFTLTVLCQSITVNPSTIPGATAGSAYNQVFTQTGGNAPVTFALSGALPAGMSFTAGTATLSGTPTQVGSFPFTVTATDANLCAGSRNYTLVVGAMMLVWTGSASADWHAAANWTPNAVPTTFNDVLIPTAGVSNQPAISAGSSSINAMTLQSSRVLTINSALELSTAADVTSAGMITGAGKLAVGGASFTQNGTVSLASVEFNAGNHSLTGGGAFASGITTVLNGANVTLSSSHSLSVLVINSGGSFDCSNQVLTLTGAGTPIFNSGSVTATGGTIIYQGSVAQVVTNNIAYNNLTINNATGVSLAGDTTAGGQLSLLNDLVTGTFTLTMPATGSSSGTGDVVGNVKRTGFTNGIPLSFGNPLNTIRFDSGTAPGDVTVNLVKSTPAGFPTNTVSRTYTITPTGGSAFVATLRLRYRDTELNGLSESTLELWRFNGSSWVSPDGAAGRDPAQNFVEETGITAFSPWAIAGPSGPTLVELISFSATGYEGGVLLEWKTGFEADNLGFNIYRDEDGKRSVVNSQLVAGSALTAGSSVVAGQSYALWDKGISDCGSLIADCQRAAYWLEDVDLKGHVRLHGPIAIQKAEGGRQKAVQTAKTLAALNNVQAPSVPVEFRASLRAFNSIALGQPQTLIADSPGTLKLQVKREGWYQLSGRELLEAGLPDVDPRNLQLFVDGKQQPIRISGQEDGRLDSTDTIEFYGVGIESSFTDLRAYYLVAAKQPGLRIATVDSSAEPTEGGSFEFTVERRDRSIYFSALRNGDRENFFGAVVASQPVNQTLTLNHLLGSSASASLKVALQGVTMVQHVVSVSLNGSNVGQLIFHGQAADEATIPIPSSLLREGENEVTLTPQGGASDISLVDHIRIAYQHSFIADDNLLKLEAAPGQQLTIGGFTSPEIQVFDVTDPFSVHELAGYISKDETGAFAASLIVPGSKGQRSLLALTRDKASAVSSIEADQPSTLRNLAQGADLLIISRRELLDSFQALTQLRQRQGLGVMLVDIEDIYDEFSFGQKSPYALREFLVLASSSWNKKPRFVLFAGDATYDPKNYLGLGSSDLVPTKLVDTDYMETASDDWLADFDGDGVADLAIGRLPVRTAEEATSIVSKIIAYERSAPSHEILLASDENEGFDFEGASTELASLVPNSLRVNQVNRGSVGTETAKKLLLDGIQRGQKIVNYSGHGSANIWRGDLLTATEARELTNGRLPLFVMMTCLNGFFHDAVSDSLGEGLMKAEHGGAVAVWASSGMTLPAGQALLNQEFYRLLFNRVGSITVGEAAIRAKASIRDSDIRQTWILLGDPAMRLR